MPLLRSTQTRCEISKMSDVEITKMFRPPDIECLKCAKLCQLAYQEFCVECLASFMVSAPKCRKEMESWKFEDFINYLFTEEEYMKFSVGAINRTPYKTDGTGNLMSEVSEKSLSNVSKSERKLCETTDELDICDEDGSMKLDGSDDAHKADFKISHRLNRLTKSKRRKSAIQDFPIETIKRKRGRPRTRPLLNLIIQ